MPAMLIVTKFCSRLSLRSDVAVHLLILLLVGHTRSIYFRLRLIHERDSHERSEPDVKTGMTKGESESRKLISP